MKVSPPLAAWLGGRAGGHGGRGAVAEFKLECALTDLDAVVADERLTSVPILLATAPR